MNEKERNIYCQTCLGSALKLFEFINFRNASPVKVLLNYPELSGLIDVNT